MELKTELLAASKDIAPPAAVTTVTKVFNLSNVTLQDLALYLTIAYAAVRLLFLVPRAIGCMRCFRKNGTCKLTCKAEPLV